MCFFFRKCFAVSGFVLLFSGCVFLFGDACFRFGLCISVSCLAFFLFLAFAMVTQFLEKNYGCIVVLANLENLYTLTAFIFFFNLSLSGLTSRCNLWRVEEWVLLYSRNFKIKRRDGNENVKKTPIGSVGRTCMTLFL